MSDFARYERPQQPWDCGRACQGLPCSTGPTPHGQCREANPCVPRRSLRSQRRLFAIACTALTAAALLVLLANNWWTEMLAPGPLTLQHAQILNRQTTSNRCAACHDAGAKSAGEWVLSALPVGSPPQVPQSTLCLKCHAKGLDATHALLPHGVDPERLARHTEQIGGNSSLGIGKLVSIPKSERGEVACSACHREHHGQDFNLSALSNQQCQTCHARQFSSFGSGHPEFKNWPYARRTRIAFDHAAHQAKHFPAGHQQFRCDTCHSGDSRREVELLTGFEQACASCHAPKIKQSASEGWAFITLPGMNVTALVESGLPIGEWPAQASSDFDGTIPPAMLLLLAADPKANAALEKINGGDLSALDPEDKEQLQAAAQLAIASKQLIHELATEGEAALGRRLKKSLGRDVSTDELARLISQLSPDLARTAQVAWLPKLDEEMQLLRGGSPLHGNINPLPSTAAAPAPSAGWFRSDTTLSLCYRPARHADPLLKAWLELSLTVRDGNRSLQALRDSLTRNTSIGRCVECHSIDRDSSGAAAINWRASQRDPAIKGFTRFSHRPHLIQPQLQDCTHCHQIDTQARVMASYSQHDPHQFVSGFLPLSKSACSSCHIPTAAGDGCLKCHNYHISRQSGGLGAGAWEGEEP